MKDSITEQTSQEFEIITDALKLETLTEELDYQNNLEEAEDLTELKEGLTNLLSLIVKILGR